MCLCLLSIVSNFVPHLEYNKPYVHCGVVCVKIWHAISGAKSFKKVCWIKAWAIFLMCSALNHVDDDDDVMITTCVNREWSETRGSSSIPSKCNNYPPSQSDVSPTIPGKNVFNLLNMNSFIVSSENELNNWKVIVKKKGDRAENVTLFRPIDWHFLWLHYKDRDKLTNHITKHGRNRFLFRI